MAKKADAVTPVDDGKQKALSLAMDQITKQFGDGSIMKLGEAKKGRCRIATKWCAEP